MTARIALVIPVLALVASCGGSNAPAPQPPAATVTPSKVATESTSPSAAISVRIPADVRLRAGIEVGIPVRQRMGGRVTLPGTVAPDAYGQTTVATLAGGQVATVAVELGAIVRVGDPVARITSTDVADAQAAYLSHRVALEADHQRVLRLERAVAIGASSQQELDDARAAHANHESELDRATSRLLILGFTQDQIASLTSSRTVSSDYVVRANAAGVITRRDVNPGQVIGANSSVAQISRIDRVWILANPFEDDLARIHVGTVAHVSPRGGASRAVTSKVSYIDPMVDTATRTGQLRIEVPNADASLRFGGLVDVDLELPSVDSLAVPTDAVQAIGSDLVVYVQESSKPEVLDERLVTVGPASGSMIAITSGLSDGESIVTRGAFYVKAERLRMTPAASTASAPGRAAARVRIEVTASGFEPSRVDLPANTSLIVEFRRTTDVTCAKEVVVPALNIRRTLPLNQVVEIALPAGPARSVPFVCGMNMLRGTLIIR